MFAVAGRWRMDPARRELQDAGLERLVAGVRQLPGFVHGFWTRDVEDEAHSGTFIVFDGRDRAEAFAVDVRGNAVHQAAAGVELVELRVLDVGAGA